MRTIRLAALACAFLVTACGIGGPAHRAPPPEIARTVGMTFNRFTEGTVRIRVGETVQWRNTSPIGHTVTADPALVRDPANVQLPPGAEPFHSGNIPAGQVWQRTFTVAGIYRYVCRPHEGAGMVGTVIVEG